MIARLLGSVLKGIHAGESQLAWNRPETTSNQLMTISSPSFPKDGVIPLRFAGKGVGENLSPSLAWSRPPEGARELVLIMEDPDAPLRRPFVHMLVHGITPDTSELSEGVLLASESSPLSFGRNTFGSAGYQGPRALPGHGPHRYVFQVFAVSRHLAFRNAPNVDALLAAMNGAVIARGRLDGFFEQK